MINHVTHPELTEQVHNYINLDDIGTCTACKAGVDCADLMQDPKYDDEHVCSHCVESVLNTRTEIRNADQAITRLLAATVRYDGSTDDEARRELLIAIDDRRETWLTLAARALGYEGVHMAVARVVVVEFWGKS